MPKVSQLVSLHQPLLHHFALHITARIFLSKCISPLPKVFSGSPSPLSRGQVLLIPTGLYMIGPLLCFRLDLICQHDTPISPLAPTTLASLFTSDILGILRPQGLCTCCSSCSQISGQLSISFKSLLNVTFSGGLYHFSSQLLTLYSLSTNLFFFF